MLRNLPKKFLVGSDENLSKYVIPFNGRKLFVIQSVDRDPRGFAWEHVSVSLKNRVPSYEEMNFIKQLAWDPEDEVIHFFPPASQHVNFYEYCLHLWRPIGVKLPWQDDCSLGDASE